MVMNKMSKRTVTIESLLNYCFEDKPLVSIVIPVYNVEKYLERCLKSVLSQTYNNLEIILVDDGSLDKSGMICDKYAAKDNRIKVIHQNNQGQSAARNTGIGIATGAYVAFVDSDDEVVEEYIQIMLATAKQYQADIVQTRVFIIDKPGIQIRNADSFEMRTYVPGKNAINDMNYKVAVYAKLYKSSIVKSIQFPQYRAYEDDATYYRFAYEANSICMLDYFTYYYYQTDDSVMRSTNKKQDKKTDYIQIYKDRIAFFSKNNEKELALESRNRFCLVTMLNYAEYRKNGTNAKDLPTLLKIFREQYQYLRGKKTVGIIRTCIYWIFYHFPNVTSQGISLLRNK